MTKNAPIRPLRDEADYEAARAAYDAYFDQEPEPGTPDGDRFELLGMVIAKYEDEHFAFSAADPADVIALVMESRGLSSAFAA